MKRLLTRLSEMSPVSRYILTRGVALGTLLHLAALCGAVLATPVTPGSYPLFKFALDAQQTGVALYFIAVVGSAFFEERLS
jgi:hypothetical protein